METRDIITKAVDSLGDEDCRVALRGILLQCAELDLLATNKTWYSGQHLSKDAVSKLDAATKVIRRAVVQSINWHREDYDVNGWKSGGLSDSWPF